MPTRTAWIFVMLVGTALCVQAQWVNYPTPGIPRTKDGKADLTARAPRASDGRPDLSGVWQAEASPIPELARLLPGGQNGLGEDIPSKYFLNIFADFEPGTEPLQPRAAEASRGLSPVTAAAADVGLNCLPTGIPLLDTVPTPFKIVQTPRLVVMLSESNTTFRQIFTDGRPLPTDPQPSWLGSSIGRWQGDTLVVDTTGFNDRGQLDAFGHRHSTALRVTERFHRRDIGHMDMQITLEDPNTLTRAVTVRLTALLRPDTDLIEYYCSENEQDRQHIVSRN